jgi:MoaA/NifB/PqqE/SkfB family radical SAM enzyme
MRARLSQAQLCRGIWCQSVRGSRAIRQVSLSDLKGGSTLRWSIARHAGFLLRHLTVRRTLNLALCCLEMVLRRARLWSHPLVLRVCPADICNLCCTGCLLSQRRVPAGETVRRLMDIDTFKRAVHDFLPYILTVNLYDEGEPLLNRELFDMVRYLREHRVGASISTNFSLRLSDEVLDEILDCGLEHLVVPVDGATQESYSRYRAGGDLALVLSNLRRLMDLQRARRRVWPRVEVQFIEFEHNRAERQRVADMAAELGVWRFAVIQGSSPDGWRGTDFQGTPEERRQRGCYQLWVAAHINSDGSLGVCDYGEDHGMPQIGWAWEYRSGNLRNHPTLVGLRQSFAGSGKDLDSICRTCSLYRDP